MRKNFPVTQKNHDYPSDVTLVSATDLKSKITYCNEAFVEISGYTHDELIGQPHSLVRHPDMPEEAFRDMWDTLKGGHPWSALVKNRRKNGDHYWVVANATPIMRDGQPVGYLSVRTKPTPEQIDQAESLYAQMREEAESGKRSLLLHRGELRRKGLIHSIRRSLRFSVTKVIISASVGTGIAGVLVGEWAGETKSTAVMLGAFAAVTLLSAAVGWFTRSLTTTPLKQSIDMANRLAAGDLSAQASSAMKGEFAFLGRALSQLNVNLRAVVTDVRNGVDIMETAASEVSAGNHDLSDRTERQASSLEQTAASLEELNSNVAQSAAVARNAVKLSEQASEVASRGNQAMSQVIDNMAEISRSSARINEIIQVIDGISFQTNILALNAAVEAARAGEHGRGFAVVAGEVRQLASRTLEAAKEIKTLIEDSGGKVDVGSRLVQETGTTITEISQTVQSVKTLIEEITHSSDEQADGLNQINQAVGHLDSVTQQNAAMVEQLAAAATAMQSQSKSVHNAVDIFRLK